MANRYGYEDEPRSRRGGSYGLGGVDRGYNQGGYGGMESHEEGYTRGSYDRLLDVTERHSGAGGQEHGGAWDEDEEYSPRALGYSDEPWGDGEALHREAREWTARAHVRGKAPKSYTRSDARIREDVCERLMLAPFDASDVEITVSGGEVTLTGMVRSREEKWGIEDVAESVLGVQQVHNQLRTRLHS